MINASSLSTLLSSSFGSSGISDLTTSVLGSSQGSSSLLTDYASLKNGSYSKLLKAYYAKEAKNDTQSSVTASESKETEDKSTANKAYKLSNDTSSLISNTITDENRADSEKQIATFVDSYNSLINAADDSSSQKVLQKTLWLTNITGTNEDLLKKIGITVNADNTLSLDKASLSKANITTMNSLFSSSNSWASKVYSKANQIYSAAALTDKLPGSSYTNTGSYSKVNTSSMIDSIV